MDCGGYYPVGGASEIAFNMIPIIEQSGGKVLVRADVTQILCNKENCCEERL
jgi:all-trans-retinol 13,14-reductase